MNIIKRIIAITKDRYRKNKDLSIGDIRKWAFESNAKLHKRSDISIGEFTYGCPKVRSGGVLLIYTLVSFVL